MWPPLGHMVATSRWCSEQHCVINFDTFEARSTRQLVFYFMNEIVIKKSLQRNSLYTPRQSVLKTKKKKPKRPKQTKTF